MLTSTLQAVKICMPAKLGPLLFNSLIPIFVSRGNYMFISVLPRLRANRFSSFWIHLDTAGVHVSSYLGAYMQQQPFLLLILKCCRRHHWCYWSLRLCSLRSLRHPLQHGQQHHAAFSAASSVSCTFSTKASNSGLSTRPTRPGEQVLLLSLSGSV